MSVNEPSPLNSETKAPMVKGLRTIRDIQMAGENSNRFVAGPDSKLWLYEGIGVVVERKKVKWLVPWSIIERAELA